MCNQNRLGIYNSFHPNLKISEAAVARVTATKREVRLTRGLGYGFYRMVEAAGSEVPKNLAGAKRGGSCHYSSVG